MLQVTAECTQMTEMLHRIMKLRSQDKARNVFWPLERWDHGFESYSEHFEFVLLVRFLFSICFLGTGCDLSSLFFYFKHSSISYLSVWVRGGALSLFSLR
jgi:hypothetical protein